jgi:hypothetical protein
MATHAQGGSMALEDAASLEILFANVEDDTDVQNRLKNSSNNFGSLDTRQRRS